MEVEGCGRPTNLTNGDNHGTLKHGRLKRRTTPRVKLKKKKLHVVSEPVCGQVRGCYLGSGSWFCVAPRDPWDGGTTWLCCRGNCPSCPQPRPFSWNDRTTSSVYVRRRPMQRRRIRKKCWIWENMGFVDLLTTSYFRICDAINKAG